MDFSKPVNPSQNSIDISTDNITTAINLDIYFDDGALFISDGVMHMLTFDDTPKRVWNFDLKTHKLDVQDSGVQGLSQVGAIAFDTEKQVGWYYYSQDLYRLNRGKGTPTRVEVNSPVGAVWGGELVYLKNIGDAGVLVLIGGARSREKTQMVSMVDLN